MNNRDYTCTVKCLSEGTLFCIKAQEFCIKMAKDDRTWKILDDQSKHKDKIMKKKVIQAAKKFKF